MTGSFFDGLLTFLPLTTHPPLHAPHRPVRADTTSNLKQPFELTNSCFTSMPDEERKPDFPWLVPALSTVTLPALLAAVPGLSSLPPLSTQDDGLIGLHVTSDHLALIAREVPHVAASPVFRLSLKLIEPTVSFERHDVPSLLSSSVPAPPAKKKPWSAFNALVRLNATVLKQRETTDPHVGAVVVDVYAFSLVSVLAIYARQLSSPSTADQAAAAVVDLCAQHVLDMLSMLQLKTGCVVHLIVDGPPVLNKGRWARGSDAEAARALNRALRQCQLPSELFAPHQRRSALHTLRDRIFRSKHVFVEPFCERVVQGVGEGVLVELHACTGEADGEARRLSRDLHLRRIPFVLASCDRDLLFSSGLTCERYVFRNKGKNFTVHNVEELAKEAARSTLLGDTKWLDTLAPVHFHLLLGLLHELSGSDTAPTDPGVTPISVWRNWGESLASCIKIVAGDGSRVVLGGRDTNSLSATRALAMWLQSWEGGGDDPPISRSVALAVLDAVALNVDVLCPPAERSRLRRRSNGQRLAAPSNVFSSLFGNFVDATKNGSFVRARLRAKLHGDKPAKKNEYSRHVNSFVVTTKLRPVLDKLVGMGDGARSSSATKTTKTWSTGVSRRTEMRGKQATAWSKRKGDIEAFVESVDKVEIVAGTVWSVSTDKLGEADGVWAALEPEPGLRSSPTTVTIKVTVGEGSLTSKWPVAGSGRYHLRVGVPGPDTQGVSFVSTKPVLDVQPNPVPSFAKAGRIFAPASRVAAPSSGKKRSRTGDGAFAPLAGGEVPKLIAGAGTTIVQTSCELWDENFNPLSLGVALPHVTVTAVDGSTTHLPRLTVSQSEDSLVLSVGKDCQGTYHFRNANGGYLGGVVVKKSAANSSASRASRAIVKKTMVTKHGMVTLPLGSLAPLWPVERDRQVVRQFVYDLLRDRATVHLTLATQFLSLCSGDGEFSSSSLPPHMKKPLEGHMSATRQKHGKWKTHSNCVLDFVQSIQGDIAGNAAVAVREVLRDALFEAFRGEVEALDSTKTLDRPSVRRFLDQLIDDLLGSEDEEAKELSGEVATDSAGDGTGGPPRKRRVGQSSAASSAAVQSRDWHLRKHPLRSQLTALANSPPTTLTHRITAALATNGLSPNDVPSLSPKEGGGFAPLDMDVTTKLLLIVAYNRRSPTAVRRVRQKVFALPSQEGSNFAHVGLLSFRILCARLLARRMPEERAGWTAEKVNHSPWEGLVAEFAPGLTRVLDAKNARGSRFVFAQALRLSVAGARICVHELGTLQASSTDSTAVQQRGDEVRKVNSRSWRSLDRPAGKSMLRVLLDADQPHLVALRHVSDGVEQTDVRDILSACIAVGIDPGLKNVTDMVVGQLMLDEKGLVGIVGDVGRIPSAAVQPLRAGAGPYVDAPGEPRVDDEAVRDFRNDVRKAALEDAHKRPDSLAQALARAAKRNASFAGKERADHFIIQTVVSKVALVREQLRMGDDCPVVVFIGAGGYSAKATKHSVAGYTAFQLAKLLRRRFTTIVVPEFLTSQGCPGCGAKLIRGSGPSWRSRTCPSATCSLHKSEYTKDQTAALAILRIGVDQLLTGVRPACFTDQVPWYAGTVT